MNDAGKEFRNHRDQLKLHGKHLRTRQARSFDGLSERTIRLNRRGESYDNHKRKHRRWVNSGLFQGKEDKGRVSVDRNQTRDTQFHQEQSS